MQKVRLGKNVTYLDKVTLIKLSVTHLTDLIGIMSGNRVNMNTNYKRLVNKC